MRCLSFLAVLVGVPLLSGAAILDPVGDTYGTGDAVRHHFRFRRDDRKFDDF